MRVVRSRSTWKRCRGELGNGNAGNGCVQGAAADEMHPLSVMPTKARVAQMLEDDLQKSVRLERTDMGTRKGTFPPFLSFVTQPCFSFEHSPLDKTPTAPSWVSPFHKSFRMKKKERAFGLKLLLLLLLELCKFFQRSKPVLQ